MDQGKVLTSNNIPITRKSKVLRKGIAYGLQIANISYEWNQEGTEATITVTASGGVGTLEYRLDEGVWQESNVFVVGVEGTYAIDVRDEVGQIESDSIIVEPLETGLPYQDKLLMNVYERDDITLSGEGLNATILLPHLKRNGGGYAFYGGTGINSSMFDLAGYDFTFAHWFRMPTGLTISATNNGIAGKNTLGLTRIKTYGFQVNELTGNVIAKICSSAGGFVINSNRQASSNVWMFCRMQVDMANMLFSFWIDEVLIDTIPFTGNFDTALDQKFLFMIGGSMATNGNTLYYNPFSYHSDTYVFHKKLTEQEGIDLFQKKVVSGAVAHWPLCSIQLNDCSGNNYHLSKTTTITTLSVNARFGEKGSRQKLNVGYTEYIIDNGKKLHIPYGDNGLPLISPQIPVGAVKVKDVVGIANKHNLCDSYVEIQGSEWDRTNQLRYNKLARLLWQFYTTNTNADASDETYFMGEASAGAGFIVTVYRSNAWHISELNQQTLYNYKLDANATNQSDVFVQMLNNSVDNRLSLEGIITYDEVLTNEQSENVMNYTQDLGVINSHSLEVNFNALQISAQRGNKILTFNEANNTMYLSLDNGATIERSLQVTALAGIITFAHFFENGNIIFASQDKMYYSTDNLQTYNESMVLDIDGLPWVAGDTTNFMPFIHDNYHSDNVPLVWANYRNDPSTSTPNIWATTDQGLTIKQIFRFGVSTIGGNVINARHAHSVIYNAFDQSFWISTGDGTTECHWIKATYNGSVWSFELILSSSNFDRIKGTGMFYHNGYMYWASDSQLRDYMGIFRCLYSDIADTTKHERIYVSGDEMTSIRVTSEGYIIAAGLQRGYIATSIDGINFKVTRIRTTNDLGFTHGYIFARERNINGEFVCQLYPANKTLQTITKGEVGLLKINTDI